MTRWSVYLVRCRDGALYTGITTDVSRRFAQHRRSGREGAKYLRGRGPLRLVFERIIGPKSLALKVEARIKRLTKDRKEELVAQSAPDPAPAARTRPGRRSPRRCGAGCRRGQGRIE